MTHLDIRLLLHLTHLITARVDRGQHLISRRDSLLSLTIFILVLIVCIQAQFQLQLRFRDPRGPPATLRALPRDIPLEPLPATVRSPRDILNDLVPIVMVRVLIALDTGSITLLEAIDSEFLLGSTLHV